MEHSKMLKMKMKKRYKAMIIIGSFLLAVILVFVCLDGTFLPRKYNSVWSDKYIAQLESDQSRMIAYGIRAASSHNSQPWLVKAIASDTIELYADMDKALPAVDGDFKQFLISQGTFIERYKEAASHYGYAVEITYSDPDLTDTMPLIATIKVRKEADADVDTDAEAVTADIVSSSTYASGKTDGNTDFEKTLQKCVAAYPGFSYTILESDNDVEKMKGLLLEGTVVESKDEAATKELLHVFRWTEWEKNDFRYGLSLNTLPGIIKPFIQPIMKASSNNWQAFGDSSISQFKDRLALQTKYILIKCANPDSLAYIQSGQIYQQLIAEETQYDLRPAMQLLENFDAMKSLNVQFQQEYGTDGEVVFIIGVQEKTSASAAGNPRQLVADILIG